MGKSFEQNLYCAGISQDLLSSWMKSLIEHSFDSQATWVIGMLDIVFDMLSMGAFTTRHWQTSGQLVQELKVCTANVSVYL